MQEATDVNPDTTADNAVLPLVSPSLATALELLAQGQAESALPLLLAERASLLHVDGNRAALVGVHCAQAHVRLGQNEAALAILAEHAAALRKPEEAEVRSRVLLEAAALHPDGETALRLATEADRLAAGLPDPRARVETLSVLLALLEREGHTEAVPVCAGILAEQARYVGDEPVRARALTVRAEALRRDGTSDALAAARDAHALTLVLDPSDVTLRARAAALRGVLARENGHLLEAVECLDQAITDAGGTSDALRLERALAAAGMGLDPLQVREDLLRVVDGGGPHAARARVALALAALDAGDVARTERLLGDMAPLEATAVRARLDLRRGHAADAVTALHTLAAERPDDEGVTLLLAEALWRAGDAVAAMAELDGLIDAASATPDTWRELRARLGRAPVLLHLGDADGARQDARRAADLATDLHLPMHHARARLLIAVALARLELPDEALAELADAGDVARRMGADAASLRLTLVRTLLESLPAGLALADSDLGAALERMEEVADPPLVLATLLALALRAASDGESGLAQAMLQRAWTFDEQSGGSHADRIAALAARLGPAEVAS